MRRGSGILPSEALNRADEWSFSLCCVAIFFSWRFAGRWSSLRDEPAVPFCATEYLGLGTFAVPRLAIVYLRYQNLTACAALCFTARRAVGPLLTWGGRV